LETSDPAVAMKRGDTEFARYQAEFARLRGDKGMTPAEVQTLAVATAKELGTLEASEDYFDGKLQAWAKRQGFKDCQSCGWNDIPEPPRKPRRRKPRGPESA
jgi:hypothetical protein